MSLVRCWWGDFVSPLDISRAKTLETGDIALKGGPNESYPDQPLTLRTGQSAEPAYRLSEHLHVREHFPAVEANQICHRRY